MEKFPERCRDITDCQDGQRESINRNYAWVVSSHINCTCTIDMFKVVRLTRTVRAYEAWWLRKSAMGKHGRILDVFDMNFYCRATNVMYMCGIRCELTNIARVQWIAGLRNSGSDRSAGVRFEIAVHHSTINQLRVLHCQRSHYKPQNLFFERNVIYIFTIARIFYVRKTKIM